MKKISIINLFSILLTCIVFIGFSSCVLGIEYKNNNPDERRVKLTGTVEISEDHSEESYANNNYRSILPQLNAGTKYDYYLYGKSERNVLKLEKVTLTSAGGKTTFTHTMSPGVWEFDLYALPENSAVPVNTTEALEKCSLIAKTACDLSSSDGAATFTLGSSGLTGFGDFNLSLLLSDDKGATSWHKNIPESSYIQLIVEEIVSGKNLAGKVLTFNDGKLIETASSPSFPIGTYNLMVYVMDSNGKDCYMSWGDTITIAKNRTTSETVYIPDLIGKKPEKVTSLKAVYLQGSEDAENHLDYYQVYFQWDASAINNERYFELQVADISDNDTYGTIATFDWKNRAGTSYVSYTPTGELPYKQTLEANGTIQPLEATGAYGTGSLNANQRGVTLWLELGRKYSARIRAVNDAGCSDWTQVSLPDGSSGNTVTLNQAEKDAMKNPTIKYFVDSQATPAVSDSINRYRLLYNFNGGKTDITQWQTAVDSDLKKLTATDPNYSGIVEYHCADAGCTVGVPLWDGECVYTGGLDLSLGYKELKYWVYPEYFKTNPYDSTKIIWRNASELALGSYTNNNIKTFRNVTVEAVY